mgnify:CR=1 FL=1
MRKGRWNHTVCDVTAEVNVVPLTCAVDRTQRSADQRQVRCVGGQRRREFGVHRRGAHP